MNSLLKILICGLLITNSAFAQDKDSPVIRVSGKSELTAKPTLTMISFSVKSKGESYEEAVEGLVNRVDKLSSAMLKAKVKEEGLVTSQFNINKNVVYDRGARQDRGFIASQNLTVQFPQSKDRLLEVLNAATRSGAQAEINISFTLDEENKGKVQDELIVLATKDARHKADLMAESSGYQVTGVKEISYQQMTVHPSPMYASRSMEAMDVSANVSNFDVADLSFSDGVNVVYYIQKQTK